MVKYGSASATWLSTLPLGAMACETADFTGSNLSSSHIAPAGGMVLVMLKEAARLRAKNRAAVAVRMM